MGTFEILKVKLKFSKVLVELYPLVACVPV